MRRRKAKSFPVSDRQAGSDAHQCWAVHLSGEGEIVQAGNAQHRVVDAFASEAAVAEDLVVLHAGEGVLDAGPDLAVGGVVLLLPCLELGLAVSAAVRDDQARAPVAAVRDHPRVAEGGLRARQLPCLAVVCGCRARASRRSRRDECQRQ